MDILPDIGYPNLSCILGIQISARKSTLYLVKYIVGYWISKCQPDIGYQHPAGYWISKFQLNIQPDILLDIEYPNCNQISSWILDIQIPVRYLTGYSARYYKFRFQPDIHIPVRYPTGYCISKFQIYIGCLNWSWTLDVQISVRNLSGDGGGGDDKTPLYFPTPSSINNDGMLLRSSLATIQNCLDLCNMDNMISGSQGKVASQMIL